MQEIPKPNDKMFPHIGRSKITRQQMLEIKRLYQSGKDKNHIARRIGLSPATVDNHIHFRNWEKL